LLDALKNGERHHLALLLALWTGQRQGDLLRLPWSGYDGASIRMRQSKTGIRVIIPVGTPLKAALDAAAKARQSTLILTNSEGRPWTADGFRSSWRKACAAIGIVGVTFHDLRGTAVTRLAIAGCTEAEIATNTTISIEIRPSVKARSASSKGQKGNELLNPRLKPFRNVLLGMDGKMNEINRLGDEDSNLD
jgi:integrase